MNTDRFRQIAVIVTFLTTIVVNALSTLLPINGLTPDQVSDSFQNFFTPAGYVFSIWSVIYLGLIAYTVYQALPGQASRPVHRAIGWLFVASNLFNAAWIFAWHYLLFPLSWVFMLGILVTLLTLFFRLDRLRPELTGAETWLILGPFTIYTAWINVATIANTTILLQHLGWNGAPLPEPVWSVVVQLVGAGIAIFVTWTRRNPAFGAVFVWAFVGIGVKYADTALVAYTAYGLAAVILAVVILSLTPRSGEGAQGGGKKFGSLSSGKAPAA